MKKITFILLSIVLLMLSGCGQEIKQVDEPIQTTTSSEAASTDTSATDTTDSETTVSVKDNVNADTVTSETVGSQDSVNTTSQSVPDSVVNITAAGDNLIHSSIYKQAKNRSKDGTYDFDFAYENVQKLINGDINIINQETPICNDIYEPSDYPCFNSPTQLGDKMMSMGFNVFNLANNHCLDRGTDGSFATLDYFNSRKALTCGMYRDVSDKDNIRTMTKNNITFSFLGFTEHTNGLTKRKDSTLQIIYTSDEAEIEKEIKAAKKISDVVIVSVHWGTENSHIVNDNQKALAQKMCNWGADIIIGTHPHVIQSVEELQKDKGDKTLVAYSLGNFISAQSVNNRMIGGVLDFSVRKNNVTGKINYENVKFIPIVTQYGYGYSNITVYPFSEYTEEMAANHGVNAVSPISYDFIVDTLKQNIDKKYLQLP